MTQRPPQAFAALLVVVVALVAFPCQVASRPRLVHAQLNSTAGCTTPQGVAMGAIARMDSPTRNFHLDAWLAVANRRAYSSAHGVPIYVATHALSSRHPSWDKIPLASIAMQHSCAEWLWFLDASDGFIMNLEANIQDVINVAIDTWRNRPPAGMSQEAWKAETADNPYPDVIVARDCNGMNAGSMLMRNTPWMRNHLEEVWATSGPEIPNIGVWWEQAALIYQSQHNREAAKHYVYIPQHLMNAYPDPGCGDQWKEGDLAVHMPGAFKGSLAIEKGWLDRVPLATLGDGRSVQPPQMFQVMQLSTATEHHLHTESDTESVQTVPWAKDEGRQFFGKYVCLHERRHVFNPGWPIEEPRMVAHIANAYLTEWHLKTFRSHGHEAVKLANGRGQGPQQRKNDRQH